MNSLVMITPPKPNPDDPIGRPFCKVGVNDLNLLVGNVPRPVLLIGREPVDGSLSLRALRLLDILLALCWARLEVVTTDDVFGKAFLRLQLGEAARANNDRLDAAFAELLTFKWRLPVAFRSSLFVEEAILADVCKVGRGYTWRFTQAFIDLCQNVPLWAPYGLPHSLNFKHPIAHRLHELLAVFVRREFPIWNVLVPELRRLLGDPRSTLSDNQFVTGTIAEATAEVAKVMGWSIKIDRLPNSVVGPTKSVRFTIQRPASSGKGER